MEVKKSYLNLEKLQSFVSSETCDKIIFAIASFLLALLTTRGLTFGKYAPFAVAFTASAPKKSLPFALTGAIFGYILPSPVYVPFRYIVTVVAIGAIRWALSELKRVNQSQLFAPIVAFLPLISTGITVSLINNSVSSTAYLFVAEAFLSAGASFFFKRSTLIFSERPLKSSLDNIDIACLSISLGIIILSFNEVMLWGISIGRILMVLMVLICSGAGGIAGGAISGVAAGAIGGLSGLGVSYLSGAYGLGGLMAGIFSGISKIFGVIAFIIAHGVASIQIGSNTAVISAAIEVAIATVIYMICPQSETISEMFSIKKDKKIGDSLRNNIIMKLNHSSKALISVAGSVNEISQKLANGNKVTASYVFNQASSKVCGDCGLRAVCWRKNKSESIASFSSLMPYLKSKGFIELDDFSESFKTKCSKTAELKTQINKFYQVYLDKQKSEIRSANLRDISAEQFNVSSALLSDMASEISLFENFDEEASRRVYEVFRKIDITPIEVCCRVNRHGRITIEAEIEKSKHIVLNKANLVKEISNACGRTFSLPCISNTEYSYKLQMCQKPSLDVKVGISQDSADTLCGDSAVSFYDGQGKYIAIVCDGMGTGGMAAVDGAMASSIVENLLKAGIGYGTTLRLVNSALMSKSEEETLATVDITTLDLHSGKCEFRKAGAATTFVKKGKKIVCVEENSLPVGIMSDVKFSLSLEQLKKDDLILMVSDGVTCNGTDWIFECIENYDGGDPNDLASDIVYYANKNRIDEHKDDITALVIVICDNKD